VTINVVFGSGLSNNMRQGWFSLGEADVEFAGGWRTFGGCLCSALATEGYRLET
jgi:hypothetical protein